MDVRPEVVIEDDMVVVEPGLRASTTVRVRNTGDQLARYRISVVEHSAAAPFAWVEPDELRLFEDRVETATVHFDPPNDTNTPTGVLPYAIRVEPVEGIDQVPSVQEADLSVGAIHALQVRLRPVHSRGRFRGKHRLEIHNRGSDPIKVAVDATDDEDNSRLQFAFSRAHDRLTIPAGATTDAFFNVRPDRIMPFGKAVDQPFRVLYRKRAERRAAVGPGPTVGGEVELDVAGSYTQKPVVSKWMFVAAALLIVLAVAIAVYRSATAPDALLEPPEPPEVASRVEVDDESVSVRYGVSDSAADDGVFRLESLADCESRDFFSAEEVESFEEQIQGIGTFTLEGEGEFDRLTPTCFRARVETADGRRSVWVSDDENLYWPGGSSADPPTNVFASFADRTDPDAPQQVVVTWEPGEVPDGVNRVLFQVLVNGSAVGDPTDQLTRTFTPDESLLAEPLMSIHVQAVDGDSNEPLGVSMEPFPLSRDQQPAPPTTTAPSGPPGPEGFWIELTRGAEAESFASTAAAFANQQLGDRLPDRPVPQVVGEEVTITAPAEILPVYKEGLHVVVIDGFGSEADAVSVCLDYNTRVRDLGSAGEFGALQPNCAAFSPDRVLGGTTPSGAPADAAPSDAAAAPES